MVEGGRGARGGKGTCDQRWFVGAAAVRRRRAPEDGGSGQRGEGQGQSILAVESVEPAVSDDARAPLPPVEGLAQMGGRSSTSGARAPPPLVPPASVLARWVAMCATCRVSTTTTNAHDRRGEKRSRWGRASGAGCVARRKRGRVASAFRRDGQSDSRKAM